MFGSGEQFLDVALAFFRQCQYPAGDLFLTGLVAAT
jgi:hypothetical protein